MRPDDRVRTRRPWARPRRRRLLAITGVTTLAAVALAVGVSLFMGSYAALDAPEADPYGEAGGQNPPKAVPRPPASDLYFRDDRVSSAPSHWCKIIRSTMSCRGDGSVPLPNESATLGASAGSEFVFKFVGPGTPRSGRGRQVPGNAPIYAGATRIDAKPEVRSGQEGGVVVEPESSPTRPMDDLETVRTGPKNEGRFLIEAALPPGEYVVRLVAGTPGLEAFYHFRVRLADPAEGVSSRYQPCGTAREAGRRTSTPRVLQVPEGDPGTESGP